MSDKDKQFTFFAYKHKLTGPLSTNDTTITFNVDEEHAINLAPFYLIKANTSLKVTVEIEE